MITLNREIQRHYNFIVVGAGAVGDKPKETI
jgi:hypothetical protein